jgi:16S rRNA processing protein RimM
LVSKKPPERFAILGRITAPYGVKGWVRVHPFTESKGSLLRYRSWWVGHEERWSERQVLQSRVHGSAVVAQILGCVGRDAAEQLRGEQVAVLRSALPETRDNEFYWADLLGLRVVNAGGEELGEVGELLETGANDVLVVEPSAGSIDDRQRLIPYLPGDVVLEVDLATGRILVDWDPDF